MDYKDVIFSRNLKAMSLMFEKDKSSIIPWCASFQQSFEIIKNEELDFTKKTPTGNNMIHYVSMFNNFEICRYLLERLSKNHLDVNAKGNSGWTPLHVAAEKNCFECVILLTLFGADVNAKDDENYTPLHYAADYERKEIVEFLISHGADVNAVCDSGA
ncbi:hypothetical protein TVAG_006890 [Trichomonas vaginalis G3]|uniref:Uncharacterized protein n=1 Tax=Trichomonas vaginalis (strain ATCC PRA-98 / G3) TaxID=412133 RepID=A2FC12_TRIV3|nr:proteasome regulatory particle assembly [Trichomonas vaginalis G3]EAX97558.1 hypothetical protein TVAG_006890 [Trichomonas vaginalis G3]KAI5488111.1 proteasome regulatory particle assembly [Trichomonas vaginalis G3]|eukprot:XP_001310488.1 hypothetical protein [Trichomonas vaginalis G3]